MFIFSRVQIISLILFVSFICYSGLLYSEPAVSVVVSAPDGSAAGDFSEKLTNNVIYTPCLSRSHSELNQTLSGELIDNHFDHLSIKLSASNEKDENEEFLYDLYFMIVNLSATGSLDNNIIHSQIYLFEREQNLSDKLDPVSVALYGTAESLDYKASEKIYLSKENFIAATYEELIQGSSISFDYFSLSQGTWMVLAILADNSMFKLADPRTWRKWDADIFILGSPLKTSIGSNGTGLCQ
ncbi:MAG: hypothetical protein KZQ83_09110 [gamma proteobacterium symbiont of Taylorina sp.]|nr:hypothetical protein [gamma proteobacterium symbiont of Taylorina sp.]